MTQINRQYGIQYNIQYDWLITYTCPYIILTITCAGLLNVISPAFAEKKSDERWFMNSEVGHASLGSS